MNEERLTKANHLMRKIDEYKEFRRELETRFYYGIKTVTEEKFLFYKTAYKDYHVELSEGMRKHLIASVDKEIESLQKEFEEM